MKKKRRKKSFFYNCDSTINRKQNHINEKWAIPPIFLTEKYGCATMIFVLSFVTISTCHMPDARQRFYFHVHKTFDIDVKSQLIHSGQEWNRIRLIQIVCVVRARKRKSIRVNRPVEAFVVDCFTLRLRCWTTWTKFAASFHFWINMFDNVNWLQSVSFRLAAVNARTLSSCLAHLTAYAQAWVSIFGRQCSRNSFVCMEKGETIVYN